MFDRIKAQCSSSQDIDLSRFDFVCAGLDEAYEEFCVKDHTEGINEAIRSGWKIVPPDMPTPDDRYDFIAFGPWLMFKSKGGK